MAQPVKHVTLAVRVVSLSPTPGMELTLNKKLIKKKKSKAFDPGSLFYSER